MAVGRELLEAVVAAAQAVVSTAVGTGTLPCLTTESCSFADGGPFDPGEWVLVRASEHLALAETLAELAQQ